MKMEYMGLIDKRWTDYYGDLISTLCKRIDNRVHDELLTRLSHYLDPEYYELGDYRVDSLLRGGIKPRDLIRVASGGSINTDNLTGEDVERILHHAREHQSINDMDGVFAWLDLKEGVYYGYDLYLVDKTDNCVILQWSNYTYCRKLKDWACANVHHLVKDIHVKVTVDGVEHTVVVPAHRLLSFIKDRHHPHTNDPKLMRFRRMVDEYWSEFEAEARDIMTSNVELVKAPFDLKDDTYVQLMESKDLVAEGSKMNHCVGGYIRKCVNNEAYIYHVGAPAPEGVTVEIINDDGFYRCIQAMGYGNAPNEEVMHHTNELLNDINKGNENE